MSGCQDPPPEPPPEGESLADYIEEHGAAAKKRLKAIAKLEDKLEGAKPTGKVPSGIEFFLDGSELKSSANAVLLYDDQLDGEPTKHYAAIFTGDALSGCRHFVGLASEDEDKYRDVAVSGIARTTYEICANLKYAVVIRVDEEKQPVVGEADEGTNTIPFQAGRVEATVLVFELPDRKLVGGVKVKAKNQESMSQDKFTNTLEDDLRHELYQKIAEHLPVPETASKKYLQ